MMIRAEYLAPADRRVFAVIRQSPAVVVAGCDPVAKVLVEKLEIDNTGCLVSVWTPIRRIETERIVGFLVL